MLPTTLARFSACALTHPHEQAPSKGQAIVGDVIHEQLFCQPSTG